MDDPLFPLTLILYFAQDTYTLAQLAGICLSRPFLIEDEHRIDRVISAASLTFDMSWTFGIYIVGGDCLEMCLVGFDILDPVWFGPFHDNGKREQNGCVVE